MLYRVQRDASAGSTSRTLNVETTEGGTTVRDGDVIRSVQLAWDGAGRALAVIDGHVVDIHARGTLPKLDIAHASMTAPVNVESERPGKRASQQMAAVRDRVVNAPMPGRVVKIAVAVGDEVAEGATLVVVEAMKMENDVRARVKGVVRELHVKAGDTVESGAKLVTLS